LLDMLLAGYVACWICCLLDMLLAGYVACWICCLLDMLLADGSGQDARTTIICIDELDCNKLFKLRYNLRSLEAMTPQLNL
jgi:hypothetical protein